MASQPSGYNEERNRLRLRAWEQRIQETSQTKELNPENVPLFGEPYKTNKGDELSTRIQRMLGSYEDVNNPCSFSTEALPIPTCVSLQSAHSQPNPDKSTKTPFHNQDIYTYAQTQKGMPSNIYSSQPGSVSTAASPPNQHGHSSSFSKISLNASQFSHSGQQQKESEAFSDLRGCVSLHQETPAQSPDAKLLPPPHSSSHNIDMDTRDALNRHQLQGSTDYSSESTSLMDVSTLNIKHSPKDAALPQAKTNTLLPSQSFPSLLSSKQGGIVMTQKPTAYVRPMDGQDQAVNESPELKPSPEHYAPLPDLINKSDLVKTKIMPQFMETTEKPQCVEDILREMTHSWPPLLTTLHSPSSDEPSKSPFQAKEAEQMSSCPDQKNLDFAPTEQSHFNQQSSSVSFEGAHSCGAEMTSSSDSESSHGSESDSESSAEEPPRPVACSSVKTQPDPPSVSDWQLGNWIRSSQHNSSTDGQDGSLVSQSPAHKQLLPTHNSKQTSGDASRESKLSKPQPSSHQKEFSDNPSVPRRCSETPQNNFLCQQSCKKSLSTDVSSCSDSRKLLKQAKMVCSGRSEAVLGVKCEDAAATQTRVPSFTDRPKVKMKTGQRKEDSRNKTDVQRTKRAKGKKQKAGPEVTLVLYGHCQSCGVSYPNPCSCPSRSSAQPDQPSPTPPARFSCSKTKTETLGRSSTKLPHKLTHRNPETSGHAAKSSWEHFQPPRSLLVKIDLSLLTRVPQTSSVHKGIPSTVKRPTLAIEQDEGRSVTFKTNKRTKINKKPKIVEDEAKSLPKKKRKLESKNTSSAHASVKVENSSCPEEVREQKKPKKPQVSATYKDDSKNPNHRSGKTQEPNKEAVKSKGSHKHKNGGQHLQRTRHQKLKPPKSGLPVPPASRLHREALTNRPLLTFDERQYPVKHYIKEAKKLKHKADAESDKLSKAFNYLDAAMFFVESGIAMEKDPQISVSSYTMFAETVELLKFVLKLKNPVDSSAPSSEKDFLALCLKCQSLLQMAMFRHKHKTAVTFSKTLTDYFHNSAQASHNPLSSSKTVENPPTNTSSPASTSSSTSVSGTFRSVVSIPQEIEQVTLSYVSITTLFLSAHDIWEQAEELAHRGSGLLAELDVVMGQLSLTSTMTSVVRYTRQGVHWLRLESQKV